MAPKVHDLPDDVTTLKAMLTALRAENTAHVLMIEKLKAQLARLRRMQFGSSSEKLDAAIHQLELMLEEFEGDSAAAEVVQTRTAPETLIPREKPARKPLPDHLPREEVMHWPPSAPGGNLGCGCPSCGGTLRKLGQDETEVLERVTLFKVIRHIRPKIVCRICEAITQAPMPPLPIERGRAGPGLLAHVLVSKYADHLPLYRQSEIYGREGVDLDRSTLADWVSAASALLTPLAEAVSSHVMAGKVLHADDTPVPVLAPGTGKTATGRLWVYLRDERPHAGEAAPAVIYRYTPDRKGEHCRAHLKGFSGHLHADGYAGFNDLYDPARTDPRTKAPAPITEVACWAHVRRKFFDIHKATASPLAQEALTRIGDLYGIEAGIRGKPPDERRFIRQQQALPLITGLRTWLDATLLKLSGKSELARAIRYATSRWEALLRFTADGRLEIDNNPAERAIRPLAIGRKNWLFAGSATGGERAAVIYTLIETAKLNGLDPQAYLRDVLAVVASHPINRIGELLPWQLADSGIAKNGNWPKKNDAATLGA
jgi:transposase